MANAMDLDSDNDGIPDIIEAGGDDTDNNGTVDDFIDTNADGMDDALAADPLTIRDTDNDGVDDYLDLDSDQDTLSDLLEAGGSDADDNGLVDDDIDNNNDGWADATAGDALALPDTDSDSIPDYLDLDSDGDRLFDLIESGAPDTNADGLADAFADSDNDGIPDTADVDTTAGVDNDNDGIDDRFDVSITLADDMNNNGIDDTAEPDADADGKATLAISAELPDSNNNGIPDILDPGRSASLVTGTGCSVSRIHAGQVDPLMIFILLAGTVGLCRRRIRFARADYSAA